MRVRDVSDVTVPLYAAEYEVAAWHGSTLARAERAGRAEVARVAATDVDETVQRLVSAVVSTVPVEALTAGIRPRSSRAA